MKRMQVKTFEDHLTENYGPIGSKTRTNYERKVMAFKVRIMILGFAKRTILILVFGFFVQVLTGQETKDSTYFQLDSAGLNHEQYNWKRAGIAAGISASSGFMWGLHQVLSHRPFSVFQRAFPSANEQFWNPKISWTNKYIGHDPENGRNGKPVWITDGSHMLASGNQTTIFAAGCVVTIGKRRPWWHYAADIGGSFLGYNFGNWIGWRGLYW